MSKEWSEAWIKPDFDQSSLQKPIKGKQRAKPGKRKSSEQSVGQSVIIGLSIGHQLCPLASRTTSLVDCLLARDSSQLALSRVKCNQLKQWFANQFVDTTSSKTTVPRINDKLLLLNGPTGAGNLYLFVFNSNTCISCGDKC